MKMILKIKQIFCLHVYVVIDRDKATQHRTEECFKCLKKIEVFD